MLNIYRYKYHFFLFSGVLLLPACPELQSTQNATTDETSASSTTQMGNNGSNNNGGSNQPPPPPPPAASASGVWILPSEIAALPLTDMPSGSGSIQPKDGSGRSNMCDQDWDGDAYALGKAYRISKLGRNATTEPLLQEIKNALVELRDWPSYQLGADCRSLALSRNAQIWPVVLDLLRDHFTAQELALASQWVGQLTDFQTRGDPHGSIRQTMLDRPNNWGAHATAAVSAIASFMGDSATLDQASRVLRTWVGAERTHSLFKFSDSDLAGGDSWHLFWDPSTTPFCGYTTNDPDCYGINPLGSMRGIHSIDGVIPDDQRRHGGFVWPPPRENYVFEALSGYLVAGRILARRGPQYFTWDLGDHAFVRAFRWLYSIGERQPGDAAYFPPGHPDSGSDDTSLPAIINAAYQFDATHCFAPQSSNQVGKGLTSYALWALNPNRLCMPTASAKVPVF